MSRYSDDEDEKGGRLFVGGISPDTTDTKFYRYFQQFGQIKSCLMKEDKNNRLKIYGFVVFEEPESLDKVLDARPHTLDGKMIETRKYMPSGQYMQKKVQAHQFSKSHKIFVGGVSMDATKEDLKEYFQKFGVVLHAYLVKDENNARRRHKGFGFVIFEEESAADEARMKHFHFILNKECEVKPPETYGQGEEANAKEDMNAKMFVGGLPRDCTDAAFRKYFEEYGKIKECIVVKNEEKQTKGFGFVTYFDAESVDRVVRAKPHSIYGKQIDPKPCHMQNMIVQKSANNVKLPTSHRVFIGGIAKDAVERDLTLYFERFGPVTEVALIVDHNDPERKRHKGYAFITFEDKIAAQKVIARKHHIIKDKQCQSKAVKSRIDHKDEADDGSGDGQMKIPGLSMLKGGEAGYHVHGGDAPPLNSPLPMSPPPMERNSNNRSGSYSAVPPPANVSKPVKPELFHPKPVHPVANQVSSITNKVASSMKKAPTNNTPVQPRTMPMPSRTMPMPPGAMQMPPGAMQMPPGAMQMPPVAMQMRPGAMQIPPGAMQMPPGAMQMPPGAMQMPPGAMQMPPNPMQMPPNPMQMPPNPMQMPPGAMQMRPGAMQMTPGTMQMTPGAMPMPPNPMQMQAMQSAAGMQPMYYTPVPVYPKQGSESASSSGYVTPAYDPLNPGLEPSIVGYTTSSYQGSMYSGAGSTTGSVDGHSMASMPSGYASGTEGYSTKQPSQKSGSSSKPPSKPSYTPSKDAPQNLLLDLLKKVDEYGRKERSSSRSSRYSSEISHSSRPSHSSSSKYTSSSGDRDSRSSRARSPSLKAPRGSVAGPRGSVAPRPQGSRNFHPYRR